MKTQNKDLFTQARELLEKKHRQFTPVDVIDTAIALRVKLDKKEEIIRERRRANMLNIRIAMQSITH